MADLKTAVQDGSGVHPSDNDPAGRSESERKHESATSGKNRDFDDSGESINQAHGHPRGERDQGEK